MINDNHQCNTESGPTRVLLADDHADVRSALRLLLEQDTNVTIMDDVASCGELLAQVINDCPDLILLDWELPGCPADDMVRALHVVCPYMTVIALSGRPEQRQQALTAGVEFFVSKGDPPEELIAALETSRFNRKAGKRYLRQTDTARRSR